MIDLSIIVVLIILLLKCFSLLNWFFIHSSLLSINSCPLRLILIINTLIDLFLWCSLTFMKVLIVWIKCARSMDGLLNFLLILIKSLLYFFLQNRVLYFRLHRSSCITFKVSNSYFEKLISLICRLFCFFYFLLIKLFIYILLW